MLAVLAEQLQMVFKDIQAQPATKRLEFQPEDLHLLRKCPTLRRRRLQPWATARFLDLNHVRTRSGGLGWLPLQIAGNTAPTLQPAIKTVAAPA